MPLYDYRCPSCGKVEEHFASVEERVVICTACGGSAIRQLSAPAFCPPMAPYKSPVTGQWIDGTKARREDLARNNCVEYDPGMKQDHDRRKKEAEEKLDKVAEKAVEAAWQRVNH